MKFDSNGCVCLFYTQGVYLEDSRKPFEQVYSEYFPYIYNFIYMRVVHKETAEDLCSQAFLNALTHYDSYDSSKASVKTWLCTIARNLIVNHMTSAAVRLSAPLDEEQESATFSHEDEYEIFKDPANREAARLLSLLNEDERELLSLRYGMDMGVSEIAESYGITENAVRKRIRKTLTKCQSFTEGRKLEDFL